MFFAFISIPAFLFVLSLFALAIVLHKGAPGRVPQAALTTLVVVFSATLLYTVYSLANLVNLASMGQWLSFVLLANTYAGLLATATRIHSMLSQRKTAK